MNKNLLIIFVKNPVFGKVKTRLAASIGKERALNIYIHLLQHTFAVTKSLNLDKGVFYSDEIPENDTWIHNNYKKFLQQGEDLGIRMQNAFIHGFASGYERICIIGSDCNELQEDHIEEAFNELGGNSVVIGPSFDGGYYLLGMKKIIPQLFKNKKWSTASVFQDTIKDIEDLHLEYFVLEKLNDIDEEKDLPDEIKKVL